jgi:hypothetical protein
VRPSVVSSAAGTWLIACSASAVIVSDGLTPTFTGDRRAVAHQQLLVAEDLLAGVHDSPLRVRRDHGAA